MSKNIKKLGLVPKNSADLPWFLRQPPKLQSISHYHQGPGSHPLGYTLPAGHYCLELITHGRGWLKVEDEWVEVLPGDLLWHIGGDSTIGRSDFVNPYACLAIRFSGRVTKQRLVPRITHWEEIDEVRQFTREMLRLHVDDKFDSGVLLQYVINRLYFQARLHMQGMTYAALPLELGRAMKMIQEDYAQPLRLAELAREAGWSVAHLHDKFKEYLGVTPHQALMARRIQAAREILSSSNLPMKTVAANCGFSHAAAFCAQFKTATRLSPKNYRRRQFYGHHSGDVTR
ncbi:MAG: AraC family transcriptional regulator [Verrucomicrobiales bacterium]|jgi:AraC-like DNA-binding protein|nr:AraC family transcriptional regulator [Verrucomicrobiales bacterium]